MEQIPSKNERRLTIGDVMTASPHTIGKEQPLSRAYFLMRELNVRHLPVLHGGKLVGLLSERDLWLLETFRTINPDKTTVEEAMTVDLYTANSDTDLREVCQAMADHKYGCVVVTEKNSVVGLFTTVDAARVLAGMLADRSKVKSS